MCINPSFVVAFRLRQNGAIAAGRPILRYFDETISPTDHAVQKDAVEGSTILPRSLTTSNQVHVADSFGRFHDGGLWLFSAKLTGHRSVQLVRRYIREGSLFRENSAGKLGF